ncbi:hypothetical protein MBANPS3_011683 [Mucor bainieri]
MNPHLLSLFYCKNAATNMLNIISYALIVICLLMLFMTPVGLCLLLASPFWTVVAAVSAVVAVLFAVIVRFIWVVLLLQGGFAKDEEAVSVGHRVIAITAGKYDGQSKEAPRADDLAVVSRSSLSANGSRLGHSYPEYPSLVGGSRSHLRLLENDEDSAGLFSSKPRMPEGRDACACQNRLSWDATFARDVRIAAVAAAVNKEFRGLAVPCTCGVVRASVRSFEVDCRHGSPSGVTASSRSTGLSDGAFVASATNAADMMGAVDASSASGCVPGAADPLGEAVSGVPSAAACSDAEDGVTNNVDSAVLSGAMSGSTWSLGAGLSGALASVDAAFGDTDGNGAPALGVPAPTGIASSGAAACASLVHLVAPTFGSRLGAKRSMDEDSVVGRFGRQQAKKRKVASRGEGALLCRPNWKNYPAAVFSGASAADADWMDICLPSSPPSPLMTPMDLDSLASPFPSAAEDAVSPAPMDLEMANAATLMGGSSAMNAFAGGLPPSFSAASRTSTFAGAAITRATTTGAPAAFFAATASRLLGSRPRGRLAARHRRATYYTAAQNEQLAASTTPTATIVAVTASSSATTTTAALYTTMPATATIAATSAGSSNTAGGADNKTTGARTTEVSVQDLNTNNTAPPARLVELEEFDLDPVEILDPNDYPKANTEYDEFDGFDFSAEEFEKIMSELDHELS